MGFINQDIDQQIRKNHDTNKQIRKIANGSMSVTELSKIIRNQGATENQLVAKYYKMYFGGSAYHKFQKVYKDMEARELAIMKHLKLLEKESKDFDGMVSRLEKEMKKMH